MGALLQVCEGWPEWAMETTVQMQEWAQAGLEREEGGGWNVRICTAATRFSVEPTRCRPDAAGPTPRRRRRLDDARDLVPAIRLGDDGTYELTNAGAVEKITRAAGGARLAHGRLKQLQGSTAH